MKNTNQLTLLDLVVLHQLLPALEVPHLAVFPPHLSAFPPHSRLMTLGESLPPHFESPFKALDQDDLLELAESPQLLPHFCGVGGGGGVVGGATGC